MDAVLRECARLLDMDADTVAANGTLMLGSIDIKDLVDCISEDSSFEAPPAHPRKYGKNTENSPKKKRHFRSNFAFFP